MKELDYNLSLESDFRIINKILITFIYEINYFVNSINKLKIKLTKNFYLELLCRKILPKYKFTF